MQEILEKLTRIEKILTHQIEKPLTLGEAARYLDVSKSHLYQLTHKNKIPYYRPNGKRVYFDKIELDKWIKRNPIKTNEQIEAEAVDYVTNN